VFEYRESMPVTGDHAIPSLGSAPTEAAERLKQYVDTGRLEQVVVVAQGGGASEEASPALPGVRLAASR
jgi:hypothetical protein